jgi:hypothetical protein
MAKSLDWRFTPFDGWGKLLGKISSADGVSDATFSETDIAEIVELAATGNQFDGYVAVIMRLHDGRFAAYDTSYASYEGNDFTDEKGKIFVARSMPPLAACLSDYGQRLLAKESQAKSNTQNS